MSSIIQIDLPDDLQKARKMTEQIADRRLSSAARDAALQAIQDTSEKTKAVIDGIIASVENDIQDIAINGAQKLYDSLGLNEANIELARSIVNTAMHASNLAGSAVLNGMQIVNSVDMHALPMSAESAAMSIAQTFADQFVQKLIDKFGVWAEIAIQAIVDTGALLEDIANQILEQIYKIEDFIDDQLERYIGMPLSTIRRYCNEGLRLYSQYKEARKKLRHKSADDGEEESNRDPVISKKGAKHSVDVDIDVDPKILKMELENWLKK